MPAFLFEQAQDKPGDGRGTETYRWFQQQQDQAHAGRRIKGGQGELDKKKPRRSAGAPNSILLGIYILGLHFLAVASHVPPAFVQAACVFAFVTSPAAKAVAVKATASPRATTAATTLFIDS